MSHMHTWYSEEDIISSTTHPSNKGITVVTTTDGNTHHLPYIALNNRVSIDFSFKN